MPETARSKPLEIWFQDEARVGQQGTLTRIWAERGTRPRAPRDTRYIWSYIFGAVCPERAEAAALIMPHADTQAMSAHLAEIAKTVASGAHALLILDGAGWHGSAELEVPDNITLLKLPPYSPELNPMENVWAYLRANKLAISVFDNYEQIVDRCCEAWNFFANDKTAITSIIGGVGLQIIRDWVLRFNARGPDGLVDGKSPGAPSKLNADHRRALAEVVEAGPVPAVDGVVRWRRKDLARWLLETFAISLDETTVGRELKALGFAKISARPRHYAQNELAVEAFKKNFPAELAKIRARLPKGVEIELWWQDEARIGQKNKLTRRWARRGTRPRAPRDQRTEWAYIFGAICPAKGKGAGLVMPWCDTDAMAAHLIEISAAVDPGAHAVLIVDQAGWHLTPKLAIPDNITVLALPPRSPELNPVENVWQFMRDNWLSNRIFKSYEDIVALCCQAWNNLIDQPWKIMSLGMRKWAHGF